MLSFLGILFVGYIYAVKKKTFDWKSWAGCVLLPRPASVFVPVEKTGATPTTVAGLFVYEIFRAASLAPADLAFGIVEDRDHVARCSRRLITARDRILQNLAHVTLTLAGPVVFLGVLPLLSRSILHVDVRDMIAHVGLQNSRVLSPAGLELAAIGLNYQFAVSNTGLEAGAFIQQFERV